MTGSLQGKGRGIIVIVQRLLRNWFLSPHMIYNIFEKSMKRLINLKHWQTKKIEYIVYLKTRSNSISNTFNTIQWKFTRKDDKQYLSYLVLSVSYLLGFRSILLSCIYITIKPGPVLPANSRGWWCK